MAKKLTFQEIILTLQQYWNDQGCMLMQAYDNEKGAGTDPSLGGTNPADTLVLIFQLPELRENKHSFFISNKFACVSTVLEF